MLKLELPVKYFKLPKLKENYLKKLIITAKRLIVLIIHKTNIKHNSMTKVHFIFKLNKK